MSHSNPLPSLAGRDAKFAAGKTLPRRISWAAFAIAFFVVAAPAADAGAMAAQAKAYNHDKKVAYQACRTGWWQSYWAGKPRPYWATRCN